MDAGGARRRSDNEELSSEIVKVFKDFVGRGPTKAKTYIVQDVVVCILNDTLTKAESSLVASGHGEEVRSIRRKFQETMRPDLVALVEKRFHRSVIGFMSDNSLDPDMASEVFVLAEPAD